jgi:hypothetical protein
MTNPLSGRSEPSLELRINSVDDARSAVGNSRAIHAEAVARGVSSIEFLVAAGIERQVDSLVAGVFPLKICFKVQAPLPGNFFMALPHVADFKVPVAHRAPDAVAAEVEPPEKIDRRKFNRPPPRPPKVAAESPAA